MELSRRSKIRDVWRHPVGHDVLLKMLRYLGRNETWAESQFVGNMSISTLDRLAGEGFVDALLFLCAQAPAEEMPMATEPAPDDQPMAPVTGAWWETAVVYQIYPPSFMDADHDGMGDILGVVQRLPYLSRLGVDTLWLRLLLDTTENEFACVPDLRKISPELGDEETFDTLIAAAHQRNMRVVVSFDIATTTEKNVLFSKARQKKGCEEYYVMRKGQPGQPPNNWARGAQSVWKWYAELNAWVLRLMGPGRLDLNWDNTAVRKEMASVVKYWRAKGVDGFVFGSANTISKAGYADGNRAMGNITGVLGYENVVFGSMLRPYLQEIAVAAGLPENVLLAGEVRGLDTGMCSLLAKGCNPAVNLILHREHIATRRPKGAAEDYQVFLQDLKKYYLHWMEEYAGDGWMGLFFETAETPRMVSRLGAAGVYRAVLSKLLGTMLLTLRGVPIIYQGEELGLTNTRFTRDELRDARTLRQYDEWDAKQGEDEALRMALNGAPDHARTPMPWSGGKYAGFTGAEPWIRMPDGTEYLNAAVQMEDANSVWNFYRRLIALRQENPCLAYGVFRPVFVRNKKVFCYIRISGGERWYVEMNITDKEVPRPGRIPDKCRLMLSNYADKAVTLRPYEANIYQHE